jgi:hypothetical protein
MENILVAHPSFYKRSAALSVLDGVGQANEVWSMMGTWPAACNWQELDYTSTDLLTCECTMRYDRAVRKRIDQGCVTPPEPFPIVPNCMV